MRRWIALACAAVLAASGCGNPLTGGAEGGTTGEIVIGSSSVGENQLLAHIYAGALRHVGAEVTVRDPVGSREVVAQALQDRSLTLVPEYSGNLLRYFDPDNESTGTDEVYDDLVDALPDGLDVLQQADAENTDVLTVTEETAREEGISSIADLGPHCADFVFGGPGEWPDRWEEQINETYDCEFAGYQETDVGGPVTVAALRSGEVQVANLFSTSSVIEENDFVELDDPEQMYPVQHILPLLASGSLNEREQAALDDVSAALTTEELTELNDEFTIELRNPREIADDFLREHQLADP